MMRLFGNSQGAHVSTDLLSAYLDGQVTAAERERTEAHLRQCDACQAQLESLRQTVLLVQALPRVPVPRAFALSEAQVGIRRPGAQPSWLGGLVRGLGAVTAVALVAIVAVTLLRQQPGWTPATEIARVAPAAQAPAPAVVLEAPRPSQAAPEIALAPEPAPAEVAAEEPPAIPAAAPTTAEQTSAMDAAGEPDASPTVIEATEAPQAKAAAPELAMEAAEAPAETEAAPMLALETSPATAPLAQARGLGGESGAAPAGIGGGAAQMPALAPAMIAPDTALPEQVGFAYADGNVLSVLDGATGLREVASGSTIQLPVISGSRSRIAYRVETENGIEVRVSSWDGANQETLLSEADLAAENGDPLYTERRIQTLGWIPGQARLAVVTAAFSPAGEIAPRLELWHVDAVTGERRRMLEMGPMGRAFYAPDGEHFAVLEYGTVERPEGSLTLYGIGGGAGRTALTFPASPGTPAYASQVQWLPDGKTLLFAAPTEGDAAPSTALYRVTASGDAESLGSVPAYETSWSVDGERLAYLQPTGGSPERRALILAAVDASGPQPYAELRNGGFLGWSPYGPEFLYASDNQVFAGAPDVAPTLLGDTVSVHDPRWVAPGQVLSLLDWGSGWMLVWRDLIGGISGSLASLPKDMSYDFVSPPPGE
jgi:hypothetical protein